MKRIFLMLTVSLFLSYSCSENDQVLPDQIVEENSVASMENSNPNGRLTGCPPMTGSAVYNKTGTYNCHAYVRGALVANDVSLSTGNPDPIDFTYLGQSTIQSDNNFIRVCSSSDADAIAHLPKGKDHSALKLTNGSYAYSTPGGTMIWTSYSALNYGTACDYEYYASVANVTISSPVKSGSDYTFTLQNVPSFISYDIYRWIIPSGFSVISRSNTQITVRPNSGVSGNFQMKAKLKTSAHSGQCPNGVNNIETAENYVPIKTRSFTVTTDCSGTLDGSTLNTFNSVSKYTTHYVVMNASSWTWVKTSGNATWSTSNGGKNMNFSIPSGSATFNAYGSGCNLTVTFYAY